MPSVERGAIQAFAAFDLVVVDEPGPADEGKVWAGSTGRLNTGSRPGRLTICRVIHSMLHAIPPVHYWHCRLIPSSLYWGCPALTDRADNSVRLPS